MQIMQTEKNGQRLDIRIAIAANAIAIVARNIAVRFPNPRARDIKPGPGGRKRRSATMRTTNATVPIVPTWI
jgi:hypothetical protein